MLVHLVHSIVWSMDDVSALDSELLSLLNQGTREAAAHRAKVMDRPLSDAILPAHGCSHVRM